MRIKDLPSSVRPREKLIVKGSENLTDVELLALLLSTGNRKDNAVLLASKLLRKFPLDMLTTVSFSDICRFSGIGTAKATRIIAAMELGKRTFAIQSLHIVSIQSTEDVIAQIKDIAKKKQEYMLVLYVNARHELIQKEIIAVGTLNATIIEPKEIFSPALSLPCNEIVLAHNHPSGDPTPSDDDVHFTKRIQEAGEIIGVHLLDHVIIAQTSYFSFRDNVVNRS